MNIVRSVMYPTFEYNSPLFYNLCGSKQGILFGNKNHHDYCVQCHHNLISTYIIIYHCWIDGTEIFKLVLWQTKEDSMILQ